MKMVIELTKVHQLPYPNPDSQYQVDINAVSIQNAAEQYERDHNCHHVGTNPATWDAVLLTFEKNQ